MNLNKNISILKPKGALFVLSRRETSATDTYLASRSRAEDAVQPLYEDVNDI